MKAPKNTTNNVEGSSVDGKKLLGVPGVSRATGYSLPYVYNLIYSGRLPATKNSRGKWQVEVSAVESWLATHPPKNDTAAK